VAARSSLFLFEPESSPFHPCSHTMLAAMVKVVSTTITWQF
jgi:hypothetical protein